MGKEMTTQELHLHIGDEWIKAYDFPVDGPLAMIDPDNIIGYCWSNGLYTVVLKQKLGSCDMVMPSKPLSSFSKLLRRTKAQITKTLSNS
jgi:hypothetical protein